MIRKIKLRRTVEKKKLKKSLFFLKQTSVVKVKMKIFLLDLRNPMLYILRVKFEVFFI